MEKFFLENQKLLRIAKTHPCLSQEANITFGRVHLPVSPECNIHCRFCSRALNKTEQRPGVTAQLLKPEQAVETIRKALELCPQMTVAGIAGPGDALASDAALRTFRFVHEAYPKLTLCLSTNGLMLPDYAEALYNSGVRTVTVTVNAVDPDIQSKIIFYIIYKGKRYTGTQAAKILIGRQLEGIRKMSSLGVIIKVNTVLIPKVNDTHIGAVAKTVSEAGANIYNIIPLIPQHDFKNYSPPSCLQIEKARAAAAKYIPIFRHCQHCRADACGIPGKKDISQKLYGEACLETFSHG